MTSVVLSLFAWILFMSTSAGACDLQVEGAHVPAPPPGAAAAAAYFTLWNDCEVEQSVVGASAPGASLSIHRSRITGGIARMEVVPRVSVASGARIAFEPGGLHVMVRDAELVPGQPFAFELLIQGGRRLRVLADVVPTGAAERGHDHAHRAGASK